METDSKSFRLGHRRRRGAAGAVFLAAAAEGEHGTRHRLLWLSARDADDDEWLRRASRYVADGDHALPKGVDALFMDIDPSDWDAIGDDRDLLGGPSVRCLVTESSPGVELTDSPLLRTDPRRILSGLASVAAVLDDLHQQSSGDRSAHGNLHPSALWATPEGHVVLAVPPADLWPDDVPPPYRAPESFGTPRSAGDDRFAFAEIVHECLAGDVPATWQLADRPDAGEADQAGRSTLFEWITGLAGSTIAPDWNESPTVVRAAPLSPERDRRLTKLRLILPAALVGLGLGWLLASLLDTGGDGAVVGALGCDSAAMADAAVRFLDDSGTDFAWTDSDDDCHHDAYEIHWLGTDYLVPDEGVNGERASAEMQVRVLVNYYEDTSVVRDVNPGRCEVDRVARAADAYIERAGLLVTWVDTDDDCLHDIWEANATGSDPNDPDTDGDGVVDSVDPKQGSGGLLVPVDEQVLFVADVHRRNHFDPDAVEPTDPSLCSPDAWARAARTYVALAYSTPDWSDPDGDCVHSVFEVDVLGTDPDRPDSDNDGVFDGNDADSGDGMIPPIDRQYDYIITVSE